MSLTNLYRFLLLGRYRTPRFHYGDVVMDEVRGFVQIVALSDSPISWPIGKRGRARSPVVYQGLADAVRRESNQAVCRAWGVTPQTVSKWRKALRVPQENKGTRRLHRLNALSSEFEAIHRKAWSKAAILSTGRRLLLRNGA